MQIVERGPHIVIEGGNRHLLDMRPVFKRLVTRGEASSATKIVDGKGGYTDLSKAHCQLLVEVVQTAHIGIDEDLRLPRLRRPRNVGSKAVAIRGSQDDVFSMSYARLTRWCWWNGIVVITHELVSPFKV